MSRPVLHFVSDVATPHVNELLSAVLARGDVDVRPWYAFDGSRFGGHAWKTDPAHEIPGATVFGPWPKAPLIAKALRGSKNEGFMLVGWSNATTGVLIPILAARSKRFAFFTDQPRDEGARSLPRLAVREAYFHLLKRHAAIFAVGQPAVDYFTQRGFNPAHLCNLPIPVPVVARLAEFRDDAPRLRTALGARAEDFLIVTGSRLTKEKGFDLLLAAVGTLPAELRSRVLLIVIGDGPERDALLSQAHSLRLDRFCLLPWMEFEDYCRHMCAADLVVHPARFDAFGGTTLTAVAVGVPIVGSRQAGAVLQFVLDGVNGRIYDGADAARLSAIVAELIAHPAQLEALRSQTARAAMRWSANALAATLVGRLHDEGVFA